MFWLGVQQRGLTDVAQVKRLALDLESLELCDMVRQLAPEKIAPNAGGVIGCAPSLR